MGLSIVEVTFYAHLLEKRIIAPGASVLELGESQLVGDTDQLLDVLRPVLRAETVRLCKERIRQAEASASAHRQVFGPARALYEAIFAPRSYLALDAELGPRRICADLNEPQELGRTFSCVVNNGTSEHVFDQANVFRTMHDHTEPGGLMLHWTPTVGWLNHGFYNVQPGFFFDLAAANGYDVLHVELGNLARSVEILGAEDAAAALSDYPELADACVCAAMRKTSDAPFAAPVQGFYSDHIRAGLDLAHRVRLHGSPAKQVNLALDKPAMQSSTSTWSWSDDPHADARGANNGILTGYYGFHTDFETQPWWQVDLSLVTPIRRIVVFNCLDGEMALRAAELFVLTSLDGRTWQEVYRRTDPQPFGGADGEPLQIVLPQPSLARYVRVALPGETYLHLDEVEVYAV